MAAWVWISIAAALSQNIRFMLQKQLASAALSPSGATYARFVYSAPLVAIGLALYLNITKAALPNVAPLFWIYVVSGGLAQILATVVTVALFSMRNFAVGITLKKTEVIQTAIIGFVLLGDRITNVGLIGVIVGFLGLLVLSKSSGPVRWRLDKTALMGLLAGTLFGVSAVGYRGASLSLEGGDAILRAAITLAVATAVQTLIMTIWLAFRDRAQIGKVLGAWRKAGLVGVTSMMGSYGWFLAFTLQQAAYVKAVGQIELIFSILVSTFVFGEKITAREFGGMALIGGSILIIVLSL